MSRRSDRWFLIAVAVIVVASGLDALVAHRYRHRQQPQTIPAAHRVACADISCAVQRYGQRQMLRRHLQGTVEAVCRPVDGPWVCTIRLAGSACVREMAAWAPGSPLTQWDALPVSPAVCAAVLDSPSG